MPDQPTVRVGQVWQSCDRRDKGRRLKVLHLDEETVRVWKPSLMRYEPVTTLYAVCRNVVDGQQVGRFLRIRLDRFVPTSTGYRLVEDAPAEAAR